MMLWLKRIFTEWRRRRASAAIVKMVEMDPSYPLVSLLGKRFTHDEFGQFVLPFIALPWSKDIGVCRAEARSYESGIISVCRAEAMRYGFKFVFLTGKMSYRGVESTGFFLVVR